MSTNFQIRRLEKSDLAELSKVARVTFLETYSAIEPLDELELFCQNHYSVAALEAAMNDTTQAFFGVFELEKDGGNGGEMGGFLQLIFEKNERGELSENDCNLRRIYLLEKLKGRKLGGKLMETAFLEAKRLEKRRLWLVVYNKNLAAQAFYQHLGMRECGTFDFDFNGVIHHDLVFEIEIR